MRSRDSDPLSARTHVEAVLLEGKLVYERSKDHRLRRLVTGSEPAPTSAGEPAPGADTTTPPAGGEAPERGRRPRRGTR